MKHIADNGPSDIVCNANMHVGEKSKLYKIPEEGQCSMVAAFSQRNLSVRAYSHILVLHSLRLRKETISRGNYNGDLKTAEDIVCDKSHIFSAVQKVLFNDS